MMERAAKGLAVALLALAIGALLGSVQATLKAGAIEGPSALLVTPAGDMWLGVDDALWRLSAEGRLLDKQPLAATGLPGRPANLVHGPGGMIVASVRRDPTLYFVDPATARVHRTLQPRWPDDLHKHGGRAINFAFDPQGRVAIATGGGDAVALFDADGHFAARTTPGAYVFTNGLWWSDAGLWTTDTNRFTLRLLDGRSLAPLRAVDLGRAAQGSYLGSARAPAAGGSAALIRFHDNMTDGGVSIVDAEGRATALANDAPMQPRGMDWLGGDLLVSDGESFSILRWSAQGQALPAFGDSALQAALQSLREERHAMRQRHAHFLYAAVAAALLGILSAAAAAWLARRKQPSLNLDLSQLGTRQLGRIELLKLNWRLNRWLFLVLMPLPALQLLSELGLLPRDLLKGVFGSHWPIALVTVVLLLVLLAIPLIARRIKRLSLLPEYEPLVNQLAMSQLRRSARVVAQALRPGEQVHEVFHLRPGLTWWVLTSERLLGFHAALGEATLKASHALADVTGVTNAPPGMGTLKRWAIAHESKAWLHIGFDGSAALGGGLGSSALAARVAQRIGARSAALRSSREQQPRMAATPRPSRMAQQRRAALASMLLPGLGHWQLGHGTQAVVFIVVWVATLMFFTVPMLWTLVEPFAAVGRWQVVAVVLWHLLLSAVAATDAWRLEPAAPS